MLGRPTLEQRALAVLRTLARETRRGRYDQAPVRQASIEETPFQVLVGCLVSQRVRDEQTAQVCSELFAVAPTPEKLLALSRGHLERMLYGAGFYRQKTRQLHALARAVIDAGGVPRTREELLQLPGIGPKCANIVRATCFGASAIAVDTHVHRISNRLGWVRTKDPRETEAALLRIVPTRWRSRVNELLVAHGQTICKPIGPRCPECPVAESCDRRGVRRNRRRAISVA